MTDFREIETALKAPFPGDQISWRVGSTTADKSKGMALGYIDARDIMDRLDKVVGPENWQCRYSASDKKTVCEIDIWVEGRGWVTKADGAGDSDVEAEKGALSDAIKRAASRWGVGRYLYDLETPWVAIEQRGRSSVIPEAERAKLAKIHDRQFGVAASATPRKPPPAAPDVFSGAVLAARAAIDLCADEPALNKWGSDNAAMIKSMDPPEAAMVREHYGKRLMVLRGELQAAA